MSLLAAFHMLSSVQQQQYEAHCWHSREISSLSDFLVSAKANHARLRCTLDTSGNPGQPAMHGFGTQCITCVWVVALGGVGGPAWSRWQPRMLKWVM